MLLRHVVLLTAALFVAAPAIAQDKPADPAAAPEKKICRSVVPTGSMMGKRICLTKTEWADMNRQTSESAQDALARKVPVDPRERSD